MHLLQLFGVGCIKFISNTNSMDWTEETLFNYLVDCCYSDLVKARKQLSKWDCYSPFQKHRIELKCRKKHYDNLIIEKIKYDALIKKCNDNLDIPIYINSTPKGIFIWNLFNFVPIWQKKQLRKTTYFSNNNEIEKEIAMLNVNDAKQL